MKEMYLHKVLKIETETETEEGEMGTDEQIEKDNIKM